MKKKETKLRVAIVGSRGFADMALVNRVVQGLLVRYGSELVIVSGGARGADTLAGQEASRRDIPTQIFPADWNGLGKSAGFRRNELIVDAADLVVALYAPGPLSRGTSHSVGLARTAGKPVHIFHEGNWS